MTSKEHAEKAEELLEQAHAASPDYGAYLVARAQVHATLATIKSGVTGPPVPVSNEVRNNIIQMSGWMVRHEVRASDGETVYTVRLGDGSYAALTRRQFFVQPRAGE